MTKIYDARPGFYYNIQRDRKSIDKGKTKKNSTLEQNRYGISVYGLCMKHDFVFVENLCLFVKQHLS